MITDCRLKIADWRTRTAAALLACCAMVLAYSSGPPDGKTGRPGEGTCNDCHSGVGSADSTLLAGFAAGTYKPDSQYTLVLHVQYAGQARWGFELTVVDQSNSRAGQLLVLDSANTQYSNAGPGYLKHTSAGTHPGTPGPTSWTIGWRAPATGAGPVRFYWCCNAANNNGSPSGDFINRNSLLVAEASGITESPGAASRCFWSFANPSTRRAVIEYSGSPTRPVRVYSASGRLVRSLTPRPGGDLLRVVWDGRDASGRLVPAASYFVRLGEEVSSVARVQIVR